MSEYLMIFIMALSGSLFAIGGTGFKWARRYVLPACLGLIGAFYAPWWAGLGYAVCLCAVLCMGYGERTPYWLKAIIFSGYGAVGLWFGWSWWVVITPVVLFTLFVLSNWKPTANTIFWKAWEFIAGVLIGITFIDCLK
jgi:hypothetical protein